ncbi:MAG: type II toxin-antitoxin system HicA family toxin [Deltaproteobacteria bacterium]|nr:type II toxin-antitoxin system HicA family toxin [Deltaproteobacteria bacterium]
MKVRDLIRLIEADGWLLLRTTGSHRQVPSFRQGGGLSTVAGNRADDVPPKTLTSVCDKRKSAKTVSHALCSNFRKI